MSRINRLFLSISILGIILLTNAIAQTQTQAPNVQNDPQQLVRLNVLVTDSSKRPVKDVKREEFTVSEDNVPQTITLFSEEEPPLVYGIALDASGSFKDLLNFVSESAKIMINENRSSDETFLALFTQSSDISTLQEFTSDKSALIGSLASLKSRGGQTALLDAIYVSIQHIAQYKKNDGTQRRRALILMTDGEDRNSYYSKDKVIELLRSEDVQVFVIGIVLRLDKEGYQKKSAREQAVDLLNELAKESGGLVFLPESPTELRNAANLMASYLRTQYVIGYVPSNKENKGGRRKISVKINDLSGRGQRIAISRPSYKIVRNKK